GRRCSARCGCRRPGVPVRAPTPSGAAYWPMAAPAVGARLGLLWTSGTVSALGDGVTAVAAPLLVARLTGNPLQVSGVAVAATLPWLLFSLLSGGLVDRLDRRRVMVVVDTVRAVAVG